MTALQTKFFLSFDREAVRRKPHLISCGLNPIMAPEKKVKSSEAGVGPAAAETQREGSGCVSQTLQHPRGADNLKALQVFSISWIK